MSGDHFIFIIGKRTNRDGCQQSLGENAPHKLFHLRIVFHLEGMSFKGSQLIHRQLHGLYKTLFIIQSQCRIQGTREIHASCTAVAMQFSEYVPVLYQKLIIML